MFNMLKPALWLVVSVSLQLPLPPLNGVNQTEFTIFSILTIWAFFPNFRITNHTLSATNTRIKNYTENTPTNDSSVSANEENSVAIRINYKKTGNIVILELLLLVLSMCKHAKNYFN
jgi:hypothetical protein